MERGITIPSGSRAARAIVILLALVAAVFIVRNGLGLVLARTSPALAVRVDGRNAIALSALGEARMLGARDDADVAAVERLSQASLMQSPLDAVALRNLGFVMAATDRIDDATPVLELAGHLSLRDYLTHAWLLDRRFRNNQVAQAVTQADIVLRQRDDSWPVILPALVGLVQDPRIIAPLSRALAARPYWRGSFFEALAKDGDKAAAFGLFRRLQAIGSPASAVEQAPYFLSIAEKLPVSLVHRRWLALLPAGRLPAGQSLLRDGGFVGLDAPPPFNWSLYARDDVYSELSKGPDGKTQSLYVSFDGHQQVSFATQKLVLPPGRYRLQGRSFPDGEIGQGQFAWTIRCGGLTTGTDMTKAPIAPVGNRWSGFAMTFEIPADCPAQQLWLNGYPSEVLNPGSLWVSGLRIDPIAG